MSISSGTFCALAAGERRAPRDRPDHRQTERFLELIRLAQAPIQTVEQQRRADAQQEAESSREGEVAPTLGDDGDVGVSASSTSSALPVWRLART